MRAMPALASSFQAACNTLLACSRCSLGRWSSTLRSLCARHFCTGWWAAKTALMAARSAFDPSMTKSILRFGSTPPATMSSNSFLTTVAFSVAPSRMPSTCFFPSLSTPAAPGPEGAPQRLDLGLRGLDHPPAHRRPGSSHGLGHGGNCFLVVARGDAAHHNVRHPRSRLLAVVHGGVGRHFDLLAGAPARSQAWPLDFQLAVAEHDLARLPAMENNFSGAALALLRG